MPGRFGRWRTTVLSGWVPAFLVLWVAQALAELAFSFAQPFIPLYIQELGIEDVNQAGLWAGGMAGGFAVVMGIFGPIWGGVADRYGRKLMILRALFGAAIVIGAMSLAQSVEQLFVLRLLQGSVTGVVAATSTVVSLTVPRNRLGTALGAMHAALFVGTAIGPIFGGAFSDAFGYRAAFGMTAVFFLAAGLMVTFFVHEPPRTEGAQQTNPVSFGQSIRRIMVKPEMIFIILLMVIIRVANNAPQPVLPLFVQQLTGEQARLATTTGLVLAASGVASTISALALGGLADRYGRRRLLLMCLVAASLISVPHYWVTSVWQLLGLRIGLGLALGGMLPALQAIFSDLTPADSRGMAFGLLATASAIGNGVGPVMGSVIAAQLGVPTVFVAVIPLFVAAIWLLARTSTPALGARTR